MLGPIYFCIKRQHPTSRQMPFLSTSTACLMLPFTKVYSPKHPLHCPTKTLPHQVPLSLLRVNTIPNKDHVSKLIQSQERIAHILRLSSNHSALSSNIYYIAAMSLMLPTSTSSIRLKYCFFVFELEK